MTLGKLYLDTKSGKKVISASRSSCVIFEQYVFDDSLMWEISHQYETMVVSVQVFVNNELVIPNDIVIEDNATIKLYFNQDTFDGFSTGFCNVLFYTNVGCGYTDAAINPSPTPTLTPTQTPTQTAAITPTPTVTPTPSGV